MDERNKGSALRIAVIVLAVIGALALIAVPAMFFMPRGMTGGGMMR